LAKNISINLPVAMAWWMTVIENQDVPPIQQLAMFHIINRLNKNFWQPVQISVNKLAAVMNSDRRTVKAAVNALIAQNCLIESTEGVNINVCGKYRQIESCDVYGDVGSVGDVVGKGHNQPVQPVPDNVRAIFG